MNWQPIETAPKDGTVVDLWIGGEFAGRRADCAWGLPYHSCGEAGKYCDSGWHEIESGWYDTTFNLPMHEQPTHWMPRPPAPDMSK